MFAPFSTASSVTLTTNFSPLFIVTLSVSSVANGCNDISAQSPASTVCSLISAICSSVKSALYSHSRPFTSFREPTVLSSSTFPIQTRSGAENSTFLISAANSSTASPASASFPATFKLSMSLLRLTNPPPGSEKSYVFPFTSQ